MPGTLYVVATPIGNLDDISIRALQVLRQVDRIACEDTRHSRRLLEHFAIHKPLISYHEHNEARRTAELLDVLRQGADVALISDAGTPLVSDPGYELVRAAAAAGAPVTPIPGPSAVMAALCASGLPSDSFLFLGFLPARGARRREALERVARATTTVVLFEAPHRILETLADLADVAAGRPLVAARELTKLHEEFLRGTPGDVRAALAARPSIKGEFTLVLGRAPDDSAAALDEAGIPDAVSARVRAGATRMEAIKAVARETKRSKREIYEIVERAGHGGSRTPHPAA
jgi:16S rRNA (cytidine1402-2'-O)-methyltransferase